ncbi:hypothetical protein [Mycobacterium aquaticum]|uniref:Uncharacterized protein n=1 Tax=Mycobacterium aquaticum TaxID=1927124 RepID=A0A1X0A529_9MYCO|nr:hypothetical protein [Mycobacterium aquaticum]ORA25201.1 hypothetical protein BST13_33315 [Mycobacterium aquaticum]
MSTCARPNCPNSARESGDQGLCTKHYRAAPLRGYVTADRTRERYNLLRSLGVQRNTFYASGVSKAAILQIEAGGKLQRATEAKMLAIPVPDGLVPTGTDISAIGTRRRLQALGAIGWPQRVIARELGVVQSRMKALGQQDFVTARVALAVMEVFDRLAMKPGPSEQSRRRAAASGWVPPLAWEDIDDPDEVPDIGAEERVPLLERVEEYRELGRSEEQIAKALGMKVASLKVAISREKRRAAA